MAPVVVDPRRVKAFASEAAFEVWLAAHHDREPEVWIKIHKQGSGLPSVTPAQALDVVLCWGWIDGLRKRFDERSFLQRYTPRAKQSRWSQVNRDHVARLIAAGRMTQAMDELLEIVMRDKSWSDELARKTYVAILELMAKPAPKAAAAEAKKGALEVTGRAAPAAPADPVIDQYRRKLSMALF